MASTDRHPRRDVIRWMGVGAAAVGAGSALGLQPRPSQAAPKPGRERYPFPHNTGYPHGILPGHDQDTLNRDMLKLYTTWRILYLTSDGTTNPGEVRLRSNDSNYKNGSCSEGIGYAMLISVYLAGGGNHGHEDFDGLFRYYRNRLMPDYHLMSWKFDKYGNVVDPFSAPDGDLDVALALLMAHRQWGSGGGINYRREARRIITAILDHLIYRPPYVVKMGVETVSSVISSYHMPAWFRLFGEFSQDPEWSKVIRASYDMFRHYYELNPHTGLVPYKWSLTDGRPTYSGGDTNFGYDACRVPWRVAQDFLWNGAAADRLAHDLPDRNVKWFVDKINGKPAETLAAYNIDGTDRADYPSPRNMVGPMAVAAMVDQSNQESLDLLYDYLRTQEPTSDYPGAYFQDAVMIMSMLVLTGNMPNLYDHEPYPDNTLPDREPTDRVPPSAASGLTVAERTLTTIRLSWRPSTDEHPVTYDVYAGSRLLNMTRKTETTLEFLDPGTVHPVRVIARDPSGNTTAGAVIDVATEVDRTPPAKITQLTSKAFPRSITIGWQPAADNDSNASVSYDVLLDGRRVNPDPVHFTREFSLTKLKPATSYRVRIVARDVSGNTSTSDEFVVSTTAR